MDLGSVGGGGVGSGMLIGWLFARSYTADFIIVHHTSLSAGSSTVAMYSEQRHHGHLGARYFITRSIMLVVGKLILTVGSNVRLLPEQEQARAS